MLLEKKLLFNEIRYFMFYFVSSYITRFETDCISQPSILIFPCSMIYILFLLFYCRTLNKEYNTQLYFIFKLLIFRPNIDKDLVDKDCKLMKRLLENSSYQVFFARANAVLHENGFLT